MLVFVDPEICHPANCGGRIEAGEAEADAVEAGVAAGDSPAKAAPMPNTRKIRPDINLENIRPARQGGQALHYLDYRRGRKVSIREAIREWLTAEADEAKLFKVSEAEVAI